MKYNFSLFESATAPKAKWLVQHTLTDGVPDMVVYNNQLWQLSDEQGENLTYVLKHDTIAVLP